MKNKDEYLISLKKVGKIDIPEYVFLHSATKALANELTTFDREVACVLTLDKNNKPLHASMIHEGTINQSLLFGRDVVKPALIDSKAEKIILFHNHPSGVGKPSIADFEATEKLKELCDKVGIQLIDHFVVGKGGELTSIFEKLNINRPQLEQFALQKKKSLNIVRTVLSPKYQLNNPSTQIDSSEKALSFFDKLYSNLDKNSLAIAVLNSQNFPVKVIGFPLEKINNEKILKDVYKNILLSNPYNVITGTNIINYSPEIEKQCELGLENIKNFLDIANIRHLDDIFVTPKEVISMKEEHVPHIRYLDLENKVSENTEVEYKNSFEEYKETIKHLLENNHRDFFKALVSIEKDINNEEILDSLYTEWMYSDDIQLLDPEINELVYKLDINQTENHL